MRRRLGGGGDLRAAGGGAELKAAASGRPRAWSARQVLVFGALLFVSAATVSLEILRTRSARLEEAKKDGEGMRWARVRDALLEFRGSRALGEDRFGVVVDDFLTRGEVAAIREVFFAGGDDAAAAACAPGFGGEAGLWCFDAARATTSDGRYVALSAVPRWIEDHAIDPTTTSSSSKESSSLCVPARAAADHLVAPEASIAAVDALASVSFVSSRDEFAALRVVERRLEEEVWGGTTTLGIVGPLPGSHGLMQQLLYYPAGARYGPYVEHTDCRFDAAGAAAAVGQPVDDRAYTTLVYLDDSDGSTIFGQRDHLEVHPKPGRLVAWRNLLQVTTTTSNNSNNNNTSSSSSSSSCDPLSAHSASQAAERPKLVLQRWYEARPRLLGPNGHGDPWTRCSLDETGEIESCRRYCASQAAAAATRWTREGHAAWAAFKGGDAAKLPTAIQVLEAALEALPGLSSAQIVLAHALLATDTKEADRRVCALLTAFLLAYPTLGALADEAREILAFLKDAYGPDCVV